MASKSEVGHAKNIANLSSLNDHVAALGTLYNPSNNTLTLQNLQADYTEVQQLQQDLNNRTGPYTFAVDDREAYFALINPELTKLRKAYKATEGVTNAHLEDFMSIVRRIKGKRLKRAGSNGDDTIQHSTSQLSYDQRTNNMELLVSLLQNTPNFAPNEPEYRVATYQQKKATMLAKTKAVTDTYIPLNTARALRDAKLYTAPNNSIDTANKVKDYVGTILPKSDPRYKAIAALKFSKIKS